MNKLLITGLGLGVVLVMILGGAGPTRPALELNPSLDSAFRQQILLLRAAPRLTRPFLARTLGLAVVDGGVLVPRGATAYPGGPVSGGELVVTIGGL